MLHERPVQCAMRAATERISDVGEAYERAIMGDRDSYERESNQKHEEIGDIPGWDVPDDAAAASENGRNLPASEPAAFPGAIERPREGGESAPENRQRDRAASSWVIKNKATGAVVMETFDRKVFDALNRDKYVAVPIKDYLASLNKGEPATEKTEAGEQSLIPGVKPVSTKEKIENEAKKPMRGGNAAPGGLFDEGARNQTDLLDQIAAKPKEDFDDIFDKALDRQFSKKEEEKPAATKNDRLVIQTGVVLVTKSGRETAPAPKVDATTERKTVATLKRVDAWLLDEARKEAAATKQDFAHGMLQGLDPNRMSPADRDTVNEILFGDVDGATAANVKRVEASAKTKRTAGQAAKSAVGNAAMGLKDVAEGLEKLFTDPNWLGSGPVFDEKTYEKAKPFFKAGAAHFASAGRDIAEMVRELVKYLAETAKLTRGAIEAMRPYIKRFVEDVQSGKETINAPSVGENLERGGRDAEAANRVGAANVPAAAGSTGQGAGGRGSAAGENGAADRGERVSESYAPAVGANGALELPEREPERAGELPRGAESERGGDAGEQGLPLERAGEKQLAETSDQRAALAKRVAAQKAVPGADHQA